MCEMETCLKKWMVRRCGCGPSDCQNREVDGWRRAEIPHPGLLVLTVQLAREEISFKPGGGSCVLGSGDAVVSVSGVRRLVCRGIV